MSMFVRNSVSGKKNCKTFPPPAHQVLTNKDSVVNLESYLCAKLKFLQDRYFHGNLRDNLS